MLDMKLRNAMRPHASHLRSAPLWPHAPSQLVATHLPPQDRLEARLVCRGWRATVARTVHGGSLALPPNARRSAQRLAALAGVFPNLCSLALSEASGLKQAASALALQAVPALSRGLTSLTLRAAPAATMSAGGDGAAATALLPPAACLPNLLSLSLLDVQPLPAMPAEADAEGEVAHTALGLGDMQQLQVRTGARGVACSVVGRVPLLLD